MKKLQVRIYKYAKERNWHKLKPSDVAKSIMIEGAELLELFQWDNPTLEEVRRDKKKVNEISSELADVLIYAIQLGSELKLDLGKVIEEKLCKIEKKYPAKLMKITQKETGPGRNEEYWKIKRDYRKNTNS